MTTPESLTALADRVEREEPSRELDLDVWNAVSKDAPWWFVGASCDVITCNRYGVGAIGNPAVTLDAFTTSLDSAVTLVPEGCGVTLDRYWLKEGGAKWSASLLWGISGEGVDVLDMVSPAAALTAAALRARAALCFPQ